MRNTELLPVRLTQNSSIVLLAMFFGIVSAGWSQVTSPTSSELSPSEPPANYQRAIPGHEVAFDMVGVPAGSFMMGSPEKEPERRDDEGPPIEVAVSAFWMGKHEVTWAEYQCFMKLCAIFDRFHDKKIRPISEADEASVVTAPSKLYDPSFTYETGDAPRQPAVSVTQYAAKQYTKWLSLLTGDFYRLPTEAEWEYACRAGSRTRFAHGDDTDSLGDYAWFTENSDYCTAKVGEKMPNAWGLYDMHGNVAEWVLDGYEPNRYESLRSSHAEQVRNPIAWPTKLYPRVFRGGSWDDEARDCRAAARGQSNDEDLRSYDPNVPKSPWWFASERGQTIGFRIVRPLQPPPVEERARYWDADIPQIQRDVRRRIDEEGRGERGIVDPELPGAIEKIKE